MPEASGLLRLLLAAEPPPLLPLLASAVLRGLLVVSEKACNALNSSAG